MLSAGFFSVDAARPAAGASHALGKFCISALDASLARFDELRGFYPANPFITGKRGDVVPGFSRLCVARKRLFEVFRDGRMNSAGR